MITNYYNLNTIPNRVLPMVFVSQYDEARRIYFNLFNGEETFTPSGTVTITIGTTQVNGVIDGNSVYFDVPSSLTEKAQILFGEVTIIDGGVLGTCNFRFKVDSTPIEVAETDSTANEAVSLLLGRSVKSPDSLKAVNILLGGE